MRKVICEYATRGTMLTDSIAQIKQNPMLIIHAGAGNAGKTRSAKENERVHKDLAAALTEGYTLLEKGASAEDAVCAALHVLEDSEMFNAGRGAALTTEGDVSMDACLMTGRDCEVGSVIGVDRSRHPIDVARAIKENTKHVVFAKPSTELLESWNIELCPTDWFVTDLRKRQLFDAQLNGDLWSKHGTTGAVARDINGDIAAGTSTGGITNQMPGRVGDSPLVGCGTFADNKSVAVSCTGIGEAFIKEVAAYQIAARVCFAGQNLKQSAVAVLESVARRGGDGGVIVMPSDGPGLVAYNSEGMNFGYISAAGSRTCASGE